MDLPQPSMGVKDTSSGPKYRPKAQPGKGKARSGKARLFAQQPARPHLMPLLLQHRRAVFVGILLLLLLKEVVEFLLVLRLGEQWHVLYDLILYVVLIPPVAWLVVKLLERSESERLQVIADRDLQSALSKSLGEAQTWEELVRRIVEYPRKVAPQADVTLYVFQPATMRLTPEAACTHSGEIVIRPKVHINPDSLPVGSLPQLLLQNDFVPVQPSADGRESAAPPQRFDLPVTHNERQIGVLKMQYPLGSGPSTDAIRALKAAVPVMALALEAALLQRLAAEQAAASEAERQQIAQNLHDTLAQNISYLRLKLDQLTGENAIREIGGVLQELERMRSTADEAYQQVRNTLEELNPVHGEDLAMTIIKQARVISQRAGFTLHTNQLGAPHALPPATRQQILYIVREALHNVEKHAHATQVALQFLWLETELIVKIADNGVGFNPVSINSEGHYGLRIMQHRAQEIGGTLNILPAENGEAGATGTEVTLWVPHSAYTMSQPE